MMAAVPEARKGRPDDPVTDLALVERLRARDALALEALMERYSSRIYRVAFGITRSHAGYPGHGRQRSRAGEIQSALFLADGARTSRDLVFRGADDSSSVAFESQGRAAIGTWLYRIAANAALIKRRGKRVELEVSLEDCLPTFLADGHREGDRTWLLADWSQTPEDELLSGEAREILEQALDRLPEHYRALLVLRDVEELSNEEVAGVLGESVSSVKSRLHRARMALREVLTRRLGYAPGLT